MLDTIGMKVSLGEGTGEYNQLLVWEKIVEAIARMRNCDKIKVYSNLNNPLLKEKLEVGFRFSYPRSSKPNNAYLVKSKEECLKANKTFVKNLLESLNSLDITPEENVEILKYVKENLKIFITRVDVAFTYIMPETHKFEEYLNMYKILGDTYKMKNPEGETVDFGWSKKKESIYFSDGKDLKSYNRKIIIYNQVEKIRSGKLSEGELELTYQQNSDLNRRMRIEVSKRIKRNPFTLKQFAKFDIYSAYVDSYAEYLMDTLLNPEDVERVKIEKLMALIDMIKGWRKYITFTYQGFIAVNREYIYDWDILRQAIMDTSPNENTGYHGTSTAKKILKEIEKTDGIIYFDVFKTIEDIRKMISKYCKGGK